MSSLSSIPVEIDWSRLPDPPESIIIDQDGWGGRLAFVVPWGYRYEFMDLVAGSDEVITYGGGSTMTRKVPLRHPERPLVFFAVRAECEGWGGPEGFLDGVGQEVLHSHGRVVVEFSTLPFGAGEEIPFSVTRVRHGSEYITKPGAAFTFSNGTKSSQDSGIFIALNTISITTYLNPTLNHPQITALTNKINSTTFLGYPPGHVKFDGADTESPVSSLGSRTHTKSMTFTYRELHWNLQMRGDGMMDTPMNAYTGLPPFQSAELNALIS
jgi:hypothetical protein